MPRLFITRGRTVKLTGTLLYFLKTKRDIVLTDASGTLYTEVTMGAMNASDEGEGLLSVLEHHMHSCIYPPVRATRDWGQILREPSGTEVHGNFLGMSCAPSLFYLIFSKDTKNLPGYCGFSH